MSQIAESSSYVSNGSSQMSIGAQVWARVVIFERGLDTALLIKSDIRKALIRTRVTPAAQDSLIVRSISSEAASMDTPANTRPLILPASSLVGT